jgi:hypothetical protein
MQNTSFGSVAFLFFWFLFFFDVVHGFHMRCGFSTKNKMNDYDRSFADHSGWNSQRAKFNGFNSRRSTHRSDFDKLQLDKIPSSENPDKTRMKLENEANSELKPNLSLKVLAKKAKTWTDAEIIYYRRSSSYFPKITNEKRKSVSIKHLENAADEFARRFPHRSVMEEQKQDGTEMSSESPFLLVANGLRDNWHVPDKFKNIHGVTFMLVPGDTKDTSTLFISSLGGPKHAIFNGCITADIDTWIRDNRLDFILCRLDSGGKGYEPDKQYRPVVPDKCDPDCDAHDRLDGDPYARVVVEVEYAHRSAYALRAVGFDALDNPYTRLFLAVKIWKKDIDGNFGLAAILWGKDNDNVIRVRQAVDCGTQKLDSTSKAEFEDEISGGMLPPITEWTRPKPSQGHDSLRSELDCITSTLDSIRSFPINNDWCLKLPVTEVLYKTSTLRSTADTPYLLDEISTIQDCFINLQAFAVKINMHRF